MNDTYYAIYSVDRKRVVCYLNSRYVSSTRSYRQSVDNIGKGLKIRVLKTVKGQQPYLDVTNYVEESDNFEIVKTDKNGDLLCTS